MDISKEKANGLSRLVLILLLTLMATSVGAQEWINLTSFHEVRRMRLFQDTVFMATSGGLLAVTDPDRAGSMYTNLDGLGTTDLTDITRDDSGQKWITGHGKLIKFGSSGTTRFPMVDVDGNAIRLLCVEDDGDRLWIGSDTLLILFSKLLDGGDIQFWYDQYGSLNPAPDVNDIELVGDSIWVATSSGLAVADRSSPAGLKDRSRWSTYSLTDYPELGTDQIHRVVSFENNIYAGTANGLFRLDQTRDSLILLPFANGASIFDLQIENDSLLIYSTGGLGVLSGGVISGLTMAGLPHPPITGLGTGVVRWLAVLGGAMTEPDDIYHDQTGTYTTYAYAGLPSNNVADITVVRFQDDAETLPNARVGAEGLVTVLFRDLGTYEQSSSGWERRSMGAGDYTAIMRTDRLGHNWAGTWRGGVSRIGDTVALYTNQNSTFQGVPGDTNSVVCVGLVAADNYIFGGSIFAYQGEAVAIGALDRLGTIDGWTSLGVSEGVTDSRIVALDYYDRALALGSGGDGVFYYYLGADPMNKLGDTVAHYRRDDAFLASDEVREVKFSPQGELWVGTNFGLSRGIFSRQDGSGFFVEVPLPAGFGPDINVIDFDSRGNIWIGATNGLALINGSTEEFEVFTTDNSPLLDNGVVELTLDEPGGLLYVATTRGLSIKRIAPEPIETDQVPLYPNPWLTSTVDQLNFIIPPHLTGELEVQVFTIAGELVTRISPQSTPTWDGLNQSGRPVVSGVYLLVLIDEEGESERGKVLLVRD